MILVQAAVRSRRSRSRAVPAARSGIKIAALVPARRARFDCEPPLTLVTCRQLAPHVSEPDARAATGCRAQARAIIEYSDVQGIAVTMCTHVDAAASDRFRTVFDCVFHQREEP